ncbi:MAG: LuxR C-terminal-related transcriptional regulator [Bacteroidota bacterium]|nr:LuxR C-terminal-related transcriptional regulator [Bacteroidota bacterium]
MREKYIREDKLYDVIKSDYRILQVLARFSLPLGVGDKTIEEVCNEHEVDCDTFLAVANFNSDKSFRPPLTYRISVKTLCTYLQNAHLYYIDFLLPFIRRKLIEALGFSANNDISILIIKFYDEYCAELRNHMERENKDIFPYVDNLLIGKKNRSVILEMSVLHHSPLEMKLSELKNIIIKYSDSTNANNLMNSVLYDIFLFEEDLKTHCDLERDIFVPEIKKLEARIKSGIRFVDDEISQGLTEREMDVIINLVKGMSNKEIAERLGISTYTVATHRRNISKKLDIHSPSGLTIYAIINKLVDIKDIKNIKL